jgi:hypothetical protein
MQRASIVIVIVVVVLVSAVDVPSDFTALIEVGVDVDVGGACA